MDFKTAVEILELDPKNLTPELIEQGYRKLSLQYHPDVSANSDGSKFILLNTAYEYLFKNLSSFNCWDFQETEDELNTRILAIRKAFEMIRNEYLEKHNETFESMVNNLINTLNNYSSHKRLREGINNDLPKIIGNGINSIIDWFNSRISKIVTSYDDWINGYLRSTYQKLLEDEFKFWYKSKYFYKHLVTSVILSIVCFILIYFNTENKYYTSIASLSIFFGILIYRGNVKKKYNFKENIKTLDSTKFRIHSSDLAVVSDDSASIGEAALGLGSIGAMFGLIGGPVGAAIGGAIGGLLGSIFGESLDELKQKLYERFILKLQEVEEVILKNLEEQMPKIEEELITTIKSNFNRNKEHAVKLLLQAKN